MIRHRVSLVIISSEGCYYGYVSDVKNTRQVHAIRKRANKKADIKIFIKRSNGRFVEAGHPNTGPWLIEQSNYNPMPNTPKLT